MTDEDAERYENYIIPPDQQLILDGLTAHLSVASVPIVLNETLVDETQRDEFDDEDDDDIDPSGGFELVVVDSQLTNIPETAPASLRRSTRIQKVEKSADEKWFTQPLTQECHTSPCADVTSPEKRSSTKKRSPELDPSILGRKIRKEGGFEGNVIEYKG